MQVKNKKPRKCWCYVVLFGIVLLVVGLTGFSFSLVADSNTASRPAKNRTRISGKLTKLKYFSLRFEFVTAILMPSTETFNKFNCDLILIYFDQEKKF